MDYLRHSHRELLLPRWAEVLDFLLLLEGGGDNDNAVVVVVDTVDDIGCGVQDYSIVDDNDGRRPRLHVAAVRSNVHSIGDVDDDADDNDVASVLLPHDHILTDHGDEDEEMAQLHRQQQQPQL